MKVGIGLPVSGAWAQPASVVRVAELAESLGYHSVWTFQRLLVGRDQDLDPVYRSVLDPMTALAYVAARTSRVRLGVAVVNAPMVHPVPLAKQAGTLDVLSGGRLDLGLGTGWSEVEFAATGSSPERRGALLEEYLAVLRTLFADDVSAFDGEFYRLPPSRMRPLPVQPGGPPVLLGGTADAALRRAGRASAGWISGSTASLEQITRGVRVVREAAERAGRDPAAVRVACRGTLHLGEPQPDRPLSGSYEQVRAGAAELAARGVDELFYDLNWDPLIGSPDADPEAAVERAAEIITTLAPGG
ncbi:TIGR03619 family F420-dependent LLM class oxidoreductase [Spirilliplanes yamanashiensis]|uniref:LLM class F420-dependent oxidoreductase n=1 Tax=Spirilliplanes yamanashiensis TaxID=42233 RepID=A0A8J3YCG3_9ACTN|nr:TIGR03619 family F420-dependent LLM class oxidoreductase [Spirilliplanes yamanashiensis]MDP9818980.1 putative F420-dependent oxidoreductase [Spirilliplanes yamanashiensis]GIJ05435.1 LLM class F420-dependent oxidoreductase [Spirilliplanes yamanashiensis]